MLSIGRSLVSLTQRALRVPGRGWARSETTKVKVASVESGEGSLVITDTAVTRLREIAGEGEEAWLRVSVEGGGCSGFQYKLDLEEGELSMGEDDVMVERDGAKVLVDQTSLEYLQGATVDYHVELIRAGFRITANPKAEGGCSCGASFNIKLDL